MSNKTKIGFLGLGQMGAPMAERLLAEDVELHVFDPRPEAMASFVTRGAIAHGSPKSVADAAAIVFACLPSGKISEAVALGPAGVLEGSAVRIHAEMSTIGPASIGRIAEGLLGRGIGCVDTPVSGGPAGARAGTLSLMPAGAPEAVATLRPWLERIGQRVFVMGERPGQGQTMKLVNNLIFAANTVVALEAYAMGAKAGLDPAVMVDMVQAGTGRSFVGDGFMPKVLSGSFDFGAAISIVDKDVMLGLDEAKALGVPMWAVEQAARVWRFAASQGMAGEDVSRLASLLEGWGGTPIRAPK